MRLRLGPTRPVSLKAQKGGGRDGADLDVITAVVQLPAVLDFHLGADAAFAFFRRVEIHGAQHPEATVAVQAAPHHEPVPGLEHVQRHRLEHQRHPSSDELQRQDEGR